jgi:PTH1 family peptidyl-tRNA hydrolase
MHLIVGLGNPGPKYQMNRHNVGFMVIDALVDHHRLTTKNEHSATTAKLGNEVLFAMPQTFMNLSGQSVQALMSFYKIHPDNLLVLHDEVDIPFGSLRLQRNRGHGGHNGIRDIHEKIGPDYARLKIGVGKSPVPQMDMASWVLGNFGADQFETLKELIGNSADAVHHFIELGIVKAQNKLVSIAAPNGAVE